MTGVFTDNQPDFSFLDPGETKTFSQYWYPIREIGPAQMANLDAAASLVLEKDSARVGVCVTGNFPGAAVRLEADGKCVADWRRDLSAGSSLIEKIELPAGTRDEAVALIVSDK